MKNPLIEVNDINDIRRELVKAFGGLVNNTVQPKEITELNNTAGKIVSTIKVQLLYCQLRGERPEIDFLYTKTAPEAPAPLIPISGHSGQK
jgi:hypothetical protein